MVISKTRKTLTATVAKWPSGHAIQIRFQNPHQHQFDEYTIVVSGQYIAMIDGKEIVLNPGNEIFVPKGTLQGGRYIAGTRTIAAFCGRRINKE